MDGKKHGVMKTFWDDGNIKREETFIEGKRNGLTKDYSRTGRSRRTEIFYVDDKAAEISEYDTKGYLISREPYREITYLPSGEAKISTHTYSRKNHLEKKTTHENAWQKFVNSRKFLVSLLRGYHH